MSESIVPSSSFRLAAVGAILALVLAAFVVLAAPAPAQAKRLSKADREFVDTTIETAMAEEGQPGVSISISGPAGDYTQAYGVRDLASGRRLRLSDHFRIGSITKTFTATAILEQVEAGHIDLSDTLDKWVSGIPYGDEITVRDLLAMTSGVFEYQADAGLQEEFGADPLSPFGTEDFLRILRAHEAYFPPGEEVQYNNSNYILLGIILEKVTGKSAERVITKDVIRPLGLHQTSFPKSAAIPVPATKGYCGAPGALEDCTAFNPDLFFTDGAMISTIRDLAKYAPLLGTGALLGPALEEERLQFNGLPYAFEGPSEFGYGLGLISFGNWLGHDGSVPGYGTETFFEPQTGAVIAGMENMQTGPLSVFSRIFERIGDHLYPGSMETPEYIKSF